MSRVPREHIPELMDQPDIDPRELESVEIDRQVRAAMTYPAVVFSLALAGAVRRRP